MTIYEFMQKLGEYEKFYIYVNGKDITEDKGISLHDIKKMRCEEILNILNEQVVTFDALQWIIYCEM